VLDLGVVEVRIVHGRPILPVARRLQGVERLRQVGDVRTAVDLPPAFMEPSGSWSPAVHPEGRRPDDRPLCA